MNLVKWLRKNNTKIMAVVVIVLMVGFIGGSSLTYLLGGRGGGNEVIAYFGDKHKITYYDRMAAGQELEIFTALRMDQILGSSQDLMNVLLTDLLFAQDRGAGVTLDMTRQLIQRNRFRISDTQLSEMYKDRTIPSDMYWILLSREADSAGIHLTTDEVGRWLADFVSQAGQLYGNATYGQLMESIVRRFKRTDQEVLATLGKLLSVLQYAQLITSMQGVTMSQVKHMAQKDGETLDVELIQLEASTFADKEQTPPEQTLLEHFNRYKANPPGEVSQSNPFGFGYRLPNRVQLDYIAVKLDDVASIIEPPTQEEAEQYYQQNRERIFTEQVPANPDDPNSRETVPQTKSYPEVADVIMSQLRRQKIATRAEQILEEARNLADEDLQLTGAEEELTLEQRRQRMGDYGKIAQDLSDNYSLPLHSGRTGQLSVMETQTDEYLGRMFLTGYGYSPVRLSQVVFSLEQFEDNATALLSMPPAEMYRTIGPAKDPMAATAADTSNQIMLLARVVGAEKDGAPENLDVQYSQDTLDLGEASEEEETFSVREQVVENVRAEAAWNSVADKAQEFRALAAKEGWEQAVSQFNRLYGEQAKADPNDPNVFKADFLTSTRRISEADIQVLAAHVDNTPATERILNEARVERRLVDQLYAIADAQDDAGASPLPKVFEFKPNQSYYVVRSASVNHIDQGRFKQMKPMLIRREDYGQAQSLAIVHFNPENILKRTDFRLAQEPEATEESQTEPEGEEAS